MQSSDLQQGALELFSGEEVEACFLEADSPRAGLFAVSVTMHASCNVDSVTGTWYK